MRTNQLHSRILGVLLLAEFVLLKPALSHETPLHATMTEKAALASPELAAFLSELFGANNAPFLLSPRLTFNPGVQPNMLTESSVAPLAWLRKGSVMEDEQFYDFQHLTYGYYGPVRMQNHFYDPTKIPPGRLSDGFNGYDSGMDSFHWAWARNTVITAYRFGIPLGSYQNTDSWQNARDYEYAGLTAGTKSTRDLNLAHMLYSLGHVLHLNQDLSQPDHTRNDNHNPGKPDFDPHVWIEPYGLRMFKARSQWFTPPPGTEQGWQWWRNAGFTQLEAFWNRKLYTGALGATVSDAKALNDDANGVSGATLGLAEFSNANFLGEDAKYRDCSPPPIPRHSFQFPTLFTSTTFPQILAEFSPYDEPVIYRDGSAGLHRYVRKIADGISVPHHSRLEYLESATFYSNPRAGYRDTTINDPLVLDDYHAILLPKAVKYSAGILDYFFRGKLEVTFTSDPFNYHVHVVNRSGQQLKGGDFQLFCDDNAGNRSLVNCPGLTAAYSGGLADDASFDFDIARAQMATQFILVYRGTIGVTGSSAIDPVDDGIAIASAIFKPPCTQTYRTIVVEAIPQPVLAWLTCYQQVTSAGGNIDDVHNQCGWCPYDGGLSAQDYQAALDRAQSILAQLDLHTVPASAFVPTDDDCPESWVANYYQVLSPTGQWSYEWGGFWWPEEITYYPGGDQNGGLVIGPAGGASFDMEGWSPTWPCTIGPVARAYKTKIVGYDHVCVSERKYTSANGEENGPESPYAFTINSCGSVAGPVVSLDGNWSPANPAGWLPGTMRSFHGKVAWIPQFIDPLFGPLPRPIPGCLDCGCTP